jgi:hypothetical protein
MIFNFVIIHNRAPPLSATVIPIPSIPGWIIEFVSWIERSPTSRSAVGGTLLVIRAGTVTWATILFVGIVVRLPPFNTFFTV